MAKKDDDKKDNKSDEKVEVKLDTSQFEEMFANLATSFTSGMTALSEKLDDLKEKQVKAPVKQDDDDILPNLELMDRKQFMGVMVDQVSKKIASLIDDKVSESVKPIADRLKVQDDSVEEEAKARLAEEYRELKNRADWIALLPEMQGLFKDNPSLSPRQLLALAKADNPEKVKELEDKHPELKEKKGDDKKDDDAEEGFGGLLPTSTRPGATVEKMDADQAGEKAWSKVFGAKSSVSAE